MTFSIIVPAYNIEGYLSQCVESILNQIYKDYEIILIDDGSTDNTPEICDEYKLHYPDKIKVIHQNNKGLSYARNVAINEAQGEYILFVDGDDFLFNDDVLQKINNEIDGADVISFNWTEFYDGYDLNCKKKAVELNDIDTIYDSGKGYLTDAMKYNKLYEWYVWRYAIRKEYWDKQGFEFIRGIKYEDVELTYQIVCNSNKIKVLNEIVYCYRVLRPNSIVNTVNVNTYIDGINIIAGNIKKIELTFEINEQLKQYLMNNFSCLYYSFLVQSTRVTDEIEKTRLLVELQKNVWICKYTNEKKQRIVAWIIKIFGIKNTARLLGVRRKMRLILKKQHE